MKQFTDHRSTPLKFHKFFHYIWTPLFFISSLVIMMGDIAKYSSFNQITAVNVTYALLNCILIAVYFVGFFRWKLYSWYCLYAQMAAELLFALFTLFVYATYVPQLRSMAVGNVIGAAVRAALIGIYYYKRRPLFSREGYNPKAAKAAVPNQTVPSCPSQKFCANCGSELSADVRFCIHCGTAVITQTVTAAASIIADTLPADTAEDISTAEAVRPAEEAVSIAHPAQTIETPVLEEVPAPLPAEKKTGRKLQKVHIALIAACLCAAVLGVLNIVQYTQIGSYKASADALSLQVDTLNETIDGYKNRIDQITKSNKETETDAQLYNILAQFMTEEVPTFKSKTYYSSDYVLFVPMSSYKRTFTVTAKLDDTTVSFYPVGESVTADFMEEWRGYSIDVYLIPEKRGLTTLHFSNDKNDDTFKVMIFVV